MMKLTIAIAFAGTIGSGVIGQLLGWLSAIQSALNTAGL